MATCCNSLPSSHFSVSFEELFRFTHGSKFSSRYGVFKKFRETWTKFNKKIYITGNNEVLDDFRSTILEFLEYQLSTQEQLRGDYQEWLELTMVFLGGISKNGISFRKPGAVSLARWRTKSNMHTRYTCFMAQFKLSHGENNSLKRICIFLVRIYVRARLLSSEAIKGSHHDFIFMRQLRNYQDTDPEISKVVRKKFPTIACT